MSEIQKTMLWAGVAVLVAVIAIVAAPRHATPDAFADKGQPFFEEFDPNSAAALEVIEYDEESGSAVPFKVTNQGGKWTIPSHHDYPADGQDRLAKTAAGVIGITKDDFRSDNVADHEACGVIGPLEETGTLKGRGKRVTIKGKNDEVLADFIIGKALEDRPGYHFVRVPGQKRVYVAKLDLDISTKFADWIEKDLMKVERTNIDEVVLKDYSIDERIGSVDQRDVVTLEKDGTTWKADRMRSNQEVDTGKMTSLLAAIDDLSIVGVRPKPDGLDANLKRVLQGGITQSDVVSLQSKGYYFTRSGDLLSNEGELQARTTKGILYTLRFGEVLYGSGEAVSAGAESAEDKASGPGENRYLFISVEFLPELFPEPKKPANTNFQSKEEKDYTDEDHNNKALFDAHEAWSKKVDEGRKLAEDLGARFAPWYYVISADSFTKMDLSRSDLVKRKES